MKSLEELLTMLNGKPRVDVDDLRAYCIYQGRGGKVERMTAFGEKRLRYRREYG